MRAGPKHRNVLGRKLPSLPRSVVSNTNISDILKRSIQRNKG